MRDELTGRLHDPSSARRGAAVDAAASDRFVRDFLAKAERVVVPAMLEAGRLVERRARFFGIERIDERVNCRGVLIPTSIQMNVFRRPRTVNYKNAAPHFNVVCDRAGRRVLFQRSLAPGAGAPDACGQCTLDALTRTLVADKIAAAFELLARG